jgi:large subunit ribosomal protein L9
MKLLLCKNVDTLGIVGDVVNVSAGYARNYLLPQRLATEPTQANMRRLAEARRLAERERAELRSRLEKLCDALEGVEVTIRAKSNEEGHLYGSVGRKEIAKALEDENHFVKVDQIQLHAPIRHLDTVTVDVRLADDLRAAIKVWVVREQAPGEEPEAEAAEAADVRKGSGMEAADDHSADE